MQVVSQQIVRGKITADSVVNGQILQTELLNSPLTVYLLSQLTCSAMQTALLTNS